LKETAWDRSIRLAEYIVETKNTVRKTASVFGISKSTVHTDVTKWNGERDHMKKEMISQKIRFHLFADE
jgi:putative DeoR family transcriptional regulator (stage III sporulation protein D)